jgi:hypothetical protein
MGHPNRQDRIRGALGIFIVNKIFL